MKRRVWLPLFWVVLIAVACTPAPTLRDDTFLDDTSLISADPCTAPCWQNLIVGETAWGLAQDTIAESEDYIEVDSDSDRRTGEAWIEFAYRDGPKCCRIYTADGETLSSVLLLLSPQMTVAEVVDNFGEPTYITAQAETSEQAYVALIYPDTLMVIYAFAGDITESNFTGDNEVIGSVYMSASEMETLLQTQNLYNWNGYGALSDTITGEFDITPIAPADEE